MILSVDIVNIYLLIKYLKYYDKYIIKIYLLKSILLFEKWICLIVNIIFIYYNKNWIMSLIKLMINLKIIENMTSKQIHFSNNIINILKYI